MDAVEQLQGWYARQCDGDWEHQQGITIQTLDNPGWMVDIDLSGTDLIARSFEVVSEPADSKDFEYSGRWLRCWVEDGVWRGRGDETKLSRILSLFIAWAHSGG